MFGGDIVLGGRRAISAAATGLTCGEKNQGERLSDYFNRSVSKLEGA